MSKTEKQPYGFLPHAGLSTPELTLRGIILGALITLVFTASNVYLGLKVGLTFSSSIPAAVISMAVLSLFSHSNILENNMVQTQASAAGTLSAVIFVLPAIIMVGYWSSFHFLQTMLICCAGGFLGVIFSIPLRRTMVVLSDLPYPEGVAAAEILHAGHAEGEGNAKGARHILFGAIIASVVSFCTAGLHLLADKMSFWVHSGKTVFQIPFGFSLALLSAGYLMGMAAGLAMLIGCVLCWGIFVPYMVTQMPVLDGDFINAAEYVWKYNVRFIGAGTLAMGAIWTLITLLKPMAEGIRLSFKAMKADAHGEVVERTEQDLSMRSMLAITAIVFFLLIFTFYSFVHDAPISPVMAWGLVAFSTLMVFLIGFFIASACGYMAGIIGSSNSPISGIGVIATIIVSTLLALIGTLSNSFFTPEGSKFAMALAIFTTTAIVSVASISNDNLQDLKTGQLVGATPRVQQVALIIGVAVGAMVIAPTLGLLYEAYGFMGAELPRADMDPGAVLSAPQATLMQTVTQGIFNHELDWTMLLLGLGIGVCVIIIDIQLGKHKSPIRISSLAVGLGLYLPPSATAAIFIGAVLNVLVGRRQRAMDAAGKTEQGTSNKSGVLIASGFIVGESLMGVIVAIIVLSGLSMGFGASPLAMDGIIASTLGANASSVVDLLSLCVFAIICVIFYRKAIA